MFTFLYRTNNKRWICIWLNYWFKQSHEMVLCSCSIAWIWYKSANCLDGQYNTINMIVFMIIDVYQLNAIANSYYSNLWFDDDVDITQLPIWQRMLLVGTEKKNLICLLIPLTRHNSNENNPIPWLLYSRNFRFIFRRERVCPLWALKCRSQTLTLPMSGQIVFLIFPWIFRWSEDYSSELHLTNTMLEPLDQNA